MPTSQRRPPVRGSSWTLVQDDRARLNRTGIGGAGRRSGGGTPGTGPRGFRPPLSRGTTFTLLNNDVAAGSGFSAFFHGAHSAFSLRANAEAGRANHHTDTRRRRPF